jgi:hypothetical protein
MIERYKAEFNARGETLTYVIVWTDNCPNQYKCKENFVHIIKMEQIVGIFVVHCFAVKDNFKGVWDGAGKVMKNFIYGMEKDSIRCPTAYDCFVNAKKGKYEFDDREIWKKYEDSNDKYLLTHRSTFTHTRRIIGYVADTQAEYDAYSIEYPGCIVLADRTEMITLKKALKDTKKQHQVAYCNQLHGPNDGYLNSQELPCRCTQCRSCIFAPVAPVNCPYRGIINSRRKRKVTIVCK